MVRVIEETQQATASAVTGDVPVSIVVAWASGPTARSITVASVDALRRRVTEAEAQSIDSLRVEVGDYRTEVRTSIQWTRTWRSTLSVKGTDSVKVGGVFAIASAVLLQGSQRFGVVGRTGLSYGAAVGVAGGISLALFPLMTRLAADGWIAASALIVSVAVLLGLGAQALVEWLMPYLEVLPEGHQPRIIRFRAAIVSGVLVAGAVGLVVNLVTPK